MKINVVYAVNEKYIRYAYLSILSILKNINMYNTLSCFIILPHENKYISILRNLEKKINNFKLNVVLIREKSFQIPVS